MAHGARWTFGHRDYAQHPEERARHELARRGDVLARTTMSGWRVTDVRADLDCVERLRPDIVFPSG